MKQEKQNGVMPIDYVGRVLQEVHAILIQRGKEYNKEDENEFAAFERCASIAGCTVDDIFSVMTALKLTRLYANLEDDDSFIDLAGYTILWLAYKRKQLNDIRS